MKRSFLFLASSILLVSHSKALNLYLDTSRLTQPGDVILQFYNYSGQGQAGALLATIATNAFSSSSSVRTVYIGSQVPINTNTTFYVQLVASNGSVYKTNLLTALASGGVSGGPPYSDPTWIHGEAFPNSVSPPPSQPQLTYTNWVANTNWLNWPTEDKMEYADPDGDGESNLREYTFGTDPLTFSDPPLVSITNSPGSSPLATFLERQTHGSSFNYLRVKIQERWVAVPISPSSLRASLPNDMVSITAPLPSGASACELMTTTSAFTFQEAANLVVKPLTNGIRLEWEDRSIGESGYRVERRSYNSAGDLTSTTLVASLGANATFFQNTSGLQESGYYSYSVTPTNGSQLGIPSDYAMLKYSQNPSIRDLDCDFLPAAMDLKDGDPFESMKFAPEWSFVDSNSTWGLPPLWANNPSTVLLTVQKAGPPGTFESIVSALASTSASNIVIWVFPGIYELDQIVIPKEKNVAIIGIPDLSALKSKVVLRNPTPGIGNLINVKGGCVCRNIIFDDNSNQLVPPNKTSRCAVWINGSDVFTRAAFENCVFTGHVNATTSAVLVYNGRNRFTHCSFVGNESTAPNSSYITPHALNCSFAMPKNLIENSIVYNQGSITDLQPEIAGGFWCENAVVRGPFGPYAVSVGCLSYNPMLAATFRTDITSSSRNRLTTTSVFYDIDSELRESLRPDLGADEWVDTNDDRIADVLLPGSQPDIDGDGMLNGDDGVDIDGDGMLNGDEMAERWSIEIDANPLQAFQDPMLKLDTGLGTKKFSSSYTVTHVDPLEKPAIKVSYGSQNLLLAGTSYSLEHPITLSEVLSNIGASQALLLPSFEAVYYYDTIFDNFPYRPVHDLALTTSFQLPSGLELRIFRYDPTTQLSTEEFLSSGVVTDQDTIAGISGPTIEYISGPNAESDSFVFYCNDRGLTGGGELRIYATDPNVQRVEIATIATPRNGQLVLNSSDLQKELGRGRSFSNWTSYGFKWILSGYYREMD